MTITQEKAVEVVNDLIIINNDRVEGYQRALKETKDADLQVLFQQYIAQSQNFASELRQLVAGNEDTPLDQTTFSGKVYRTWMDIKSAITGADRHAILASCEYGEDVAQKSYTDALEESAELPTDVLSLINRQQTELKKAHDNVKALRDAAKS
jgi:uncharacterized protein (TIGR02284 family)